MSAQRKLDASALTAPPAERVTPDDYQSPPMATGGQPMSPAILLQEQLAARFAETAATTVTQEIEAPEVKLPMALRIATIVGLSVALWGGIVFSAAKIIT